MCRCAMTHGSVLSSGRNDGCVLGVCWVCVGCVLGQGFSGMAVGTRDTGGVRYGPHSLAKTRMY